MSIAIYTYSDPYRLANEPYWEEIKTSPYFCASQTLVNGLRALYGQDFQQGRVTTVQNLTDALYPDWESAATMVKQHALLDQMMTREIDRVLAPEIRQNLRAAFIFNREDVFRSVRVLFELKVDPAGILMDKLTPEQKLIVQVYDMMRAKASGEFTIKELPDETEVDAALNAAMRRAYPDGDAGAIPKDRVVIHGVHQFTPIMLRGIELLGRYKKVILLFHYQSQYSAAYQTWIDIYTAFDSPIRSFEAPGFHPSIQRGPGGRGNLLADSLGRMMNGDMRAVKRQEDCEILEFDNVTEFASYVAELYAQAAASDRVNPLYAMREQIYSADSSVNDILRMVFPEQFGERQFLNYPLGRFFVAIANMWDAQQNRVFIRDLNQIRECFSAGILPEDAPGELATLYGKASALFEGCTDIAQMLSRLKRVQRIRKTLTDPDEIKRTKHIAYYDVEASELERLRQALAGLDELAAYFYEDFEDTAHNFREFYKKLRAYIQDRSADAGKLGEEYADILRRVLERLREAENIDASASFECLKATLSLYLVQETKPGKGANWIVRNFEQIDGDILRSFSRPEAATYHFACLSDEDINTVKRSEFSWPLDAEFFEVAQNPVDWKYQAYVKSRKEYKNFKRYALLYGLEFNRSKFKLSYVKRDGDLDRTPYTLLRILGVKITPYRRDRKEKEVPDASGIHVQGDNTGTFTELDYCRYRICRYRFLAESILEGDTVYKDAFLLGKYFEACLENRVRERLAGTPVSEVILLSKLNDAFDEMKRYFPFVKDVNRMDMMNAIRNRIAAGKGKTIPSLTPEQMRQTRLRELFIHPILSDPRTHRSNVLADKLSPVSADTVAEKLSSERLSGTTYSPTPDVWCQYCSNRETCVACYALEGFKEA